MVISLREAIDSLPDIRPPIIRYTWAAKLHHDSKNSREPFTLEQCESILKNRVHPWSRSTISIAVRNHHDLLPWDELKRRGARPPWEAHPELLEGPAPQPADTDLQPLLQMGDYIFMAPKNGGLVRVVRTGQGLAAAAVLFALAPLLDLLSDGKMDGWIAWCHILAPLHFRL